MRAPDPLSALAVDFRSLSAPERRSVLRALSSAERAKLKALLDCLESPGPAGAPDPRETLSPCLRTRLARPADDQTGNERMPWRMTPSARLLLEQTAREVLGREAGPGPAGPAPRESLVDAVLGLFSPRRWAR